MNRSLWWLMLCCLLAFALRVSGAADYPLDALHDDHKDYHTIAANIVSGAGYVQVEGFAYGRQPGWPFLLAGAYAIGGVHPAVGVLLNALLAMLTVAVTYRVGRMIGEQTRRRGVGEVAALLVAVDPFLIVLDQTLLSETLYTLGLMAALWALLKQKSAAFGVLVALMTLVRANGIVLIVAALLLPRRRWWRAGLAAVLVLIPWGIRNAFVIGSPSPLAPQTGQLLLGSYNNFTLNSPEAYGMWLFPAEIPEGRPYVDLPYLEREQAWAAEARAFISAHLADIPVMMLRRVGRFVGQLTYIPRGYLNTTLIFAQPLFYTLLLIGSIMGSLLLIRSRRGRILWAMAALLLPALVTAAVFYGEARFRAPYHPMLACLLALSVMWPFVSRSTRPSRARL